MKQASDIIKEALDELAMTPVSDYTSEAVKELSILMRENLDDWNS